MRCVPLRTTTTTTTRLCCPFIFRFISRFSWLSSSVGRSGDKRYFRGQRVTNAGRWKKKKRKETETERGGDEKERYVDTFPTFTFFLFLHPKVLKEICVLEVQQHIHTYIYTHTHTGQTNSKMGMDTYTHVDIRIRTFTQNKTHPYTRILLLNYYYYYYYYRYYYYYNWLLVRFVWRQAAAQTTM